MNYSVSFSHESPYGFTSYDTSGAIVSVGTNTYTNASEAACQVGSIAAVSDAGSTAALHGVGLFVLGVARLRLG